MKSADFTAEMTLMALQWAKYPALTTELQAVATALGSDTTTHGSTLEAPAPALRIGGDKTSFTNDCLITVNKGKTGNLSSATMATIINAVAAGGGSPVVYPPFPAGAAALYSLRKTSAAYLGKCVNVRRSSDNTTQDIGFDANGNVDAAAAAAFAAGSFLYVAKWYDQSGNGRDAVMATATQQPQFLSLGGHPWISFIWWFSAQQNLATAAPLALTGDQTLIIVGQLNSDASQIPLACFDGSNGWFITLNGLGTSQQVGPNPGVAGYWSQTGAATSDTIRLFNKSPYRLAATRTAGALKFYVNGVAGATASGKANSASTSAMTIGAISSGYGCEGLIGEVAVYGSALSTANLAAIDANQASSLVDTGFSTPYSGTSCVQFGSSESIALGNVLNYERTQAWTAFAAIQLYSIPSTAEIIFTNVPASGTAFPGYELWVDESGKLHVRIMHDIGAGNYIGVKGATNVVDGAKHFVAASYDGSSTVAGVKIYLDGVAQAPTIENDALTASIIGSGQSMLVGLQAGLSYFNLRGTLAYFQIDNVVRSPSYIAAHSIPSSLPPVDANTDLCLPLNEGSGVTAADTSGHSRNGTLSSASMWVP